MIRRRWAGALGALALTATASATGATATPAVAAARPMSDCSPTTGVVLAVDFSHWGGPLLRSCGSTPTTGYALLNEGGWRTTGTQHDGPAFICRIGYSGYRGGTAYPTPSQEACVLTPPTTAYWSYWHADPGRNTWTYSPLGATSYHPRPGSVDLWIFGGTNTALTEGRPSFPPSLVRARATAPTPPPATHAPAPKPTAHHGAPPAPGTPGRGTPAPGDRSAGPAPSATVRGGSATPSAPASATAPGSAAPSAPGTGAVPTGTGPSTRIVDAAPTAAARTAGGSRTPALIGVAVAAVLGAGAGIAAWRRRRAA